MSDQQLTGEALQNAVEQFGRMMDEWHAAKAVQWCLLQEGFIKGRVYAVACEEVERIGKLVDRVPQVVRDRYAILSGAATEQARTLRGLGGLSVSV